jgi:hypothetical protein
MENEYQSKRKLEEEDNSRPTKFQRDTDIRVTDLPFEVLVQILQFCDGSTIGRIRRTCKIGWSLSNDWACWLPIEKADYVDWYNSGDPIRAVDIIGTHCFGMESPWSLKKQQVKKCEEILQSIANRYSFMSDCGINVTKVRIGLAGKIPGSLSLMLNEMHFWSHGFDGTQQRAVIRVSPTDKHNDGLDLVNFYAWNDIGGFELYNSEPPITEQLHRICNMLSLDYKHSADLFEFMINCATMNEFGPIPDDLRNGVINRDRTFDSNVSMLKWQWCPNKIIGYTKGTWKEMQYSTIRGEFVSGNREAFQNIVREDGYAEQLRYEAEAREEFGSSDEDSNDCTIF